MGLAMPIAPVAPPTCSELLPNCELRVCLTSRSTVSDPVIRRVVVPVRYSDTSLVVPSPNEMAPLPPPWDASRRSREFKSPATL